MTKMHDRLIS